MIPRDPIIQFHVLKSQAGSIINWKLLSWWSDYFPSTYLPKSTNRNRAWGPQFVFEHELVNLLNSLTLADSMVRKRNEALVLGHHHRYLRIAQLCSGWTSCIWYLSGRLCCSCYGVLYSRRLHLGSHPRSICSSYYHCLQHCFWYLSSCLCGYVVITHAIEAAKPLVYSIIITSQANGLV